MEANTVATLILAVGLVASTYSNEAISQDRLTKPPEVSTPKAQSFVTAVVEPEGTLEVVQNSSVILALNEPIRKVYLGGQCRVATCEKVSPTQMSIRGVATGTVALFLWFGAPDEAGADQIVAVDLRVLRDGTPNSVMPDSDTFRKYVRAVVPADRILRLGVGHARLLLLGESVEHTRTSPDGIVRAMTLTGKQLVLEAVAPGRTIVTLSFGSESNRTVLSYFVQVDPALSD